MCGAVQNTARPCELHHATPTFANFNKINVILGHWADCTG